MKTSCLVLALTVAFLAAPASLLRADDASHLQAARNLLLASHMDQSYGKMIDQILDAQTKSAPQLAKMREPMKEFFTKYMGWDAMKDDLAKIYADNFTEQELNDITAFYKTPTGTKMSQALPSLMAEGAQLGQRRVQEHMGELKEMIEKSMAEQNAAAAAAPAPASTPAPAPAETK